MVPGTRWAICGCLLSSPGRRQSWRRPLNAPLHSHPQGLRREIQAHGTRLEEVLERAGALASLRSPEAEAVRRGQEQLQSAWAGLREAAERRQQVLDAAFQVEQYYFDVAEVEAWLGEQELLMMSEDKGKVRPGWGCGGAWGRWSPGPAPAASSRAPCAPRTNRAPCSCSRSTCSWSRAWRTTRKASRSCRASAGRCWRWGTRTGGRAGDRGHAGAGPVLRERSSRIWSFAVGNWGKARIGHWGGRGPSLPRAGAFGFWRVAGRREERSAAQGCWRGWGREHCDLSVGEGGDV